jgi:Tfp pilus assembly protein PilV
MEVLIGLIFLAIGMLAIAGLQASSMRGDFSSSNLQLATNVAQDRLEFLKSLPFDQIQQKPLGVSINDQTARVSNGSFTSLVFNRSYTVTLVNAPSGNYYRIDYVVTWNDRVSRSLTLSTFRSQ